MKIKMIVSDFDGTITNLKGEVTKKTITSINQYQEQGGLFVVATGRTRKLTLNPLEKLNIKYRYIISYCGALITDEINNKVIYQNYINIEEVNKILSIVYDNNMACLMFDDDYYYSIGNHSYTKRYIYKSLSHLVREINNKNELLQYIDLNKILKMTVINYSIMPLNIIKEAMDIKNIRCYSMQNHALEIVDIKTDKYEAIKILLKETNLKESETVCIGDSENDFCMIDNHQNGYTVNNASDKIKKVAKKIFSHCDKEPIVELIENLKKEI
ncbi:HAD family hydrolase [Acholeplasma sp. OttesenSCG-928-E16]|nr:HAD family hydrolase [Acholeplasma sp. OttesenSCG-928-E16]